MKDNFGLYLILTNPVVGYRECARVAVDCGIGMLQLRMKNEDKAKIKNTAKQLREITRGTKTLFIVNDFVDIAIEVDADGVHLGQQDMQLEAARKLWSDDSKILGLSTHNESQALVAQAQFPSYIGVGPVFTTPTKEIPDPQLGLERMGKIIHECPFPAVAIGGIDSKNLPQVLEHGAVNYAVVRAVNRASNPREAITLLQGKYRENSWAPSNSIS
jgi:thiamine-phosphate pyrophosphorylase